MGKWSSVLKWVSAPIVHPQRTLAGTGRAIKTATVGAGVGYVGWEALINDKPVMQTVGETVLGEETNAAVKDTVHGTVGAVGDTIGAAREAIGGVTDAVNNVNNTASSWGGIGQFFCNLTSGNGAQHVRQPVQQYFQRQGVDDVHARSRCLGAADIRTLRLARQDCRRTARYAAHRQQLARGATATAETERPGTGCSRSTSGTATKTGNQKINY